MRWARNKWAIAMRKIALHSVHGETRNNDDDGDGDDNNDNGTILCSFCIPYVPCARARVNHQCQNGDGDDVDGE